MKTRIAPGSAGCALAAVFLRATLALLQAQSSVTTLHSFNGTDGSELHAGLVLGTDGNFYGTTENGGGNSNGYGSVFQMTPAGVVTTLHSFANTDGSNPTAPLVLGSDGNFYGTTSSGGSGTYGTVFKITSTGAFTNLYNFGNDGTIGYDPNGLVQGSDDNFYGTTYSGGANGAGTIFVITPAGSLTLLHAFTGTDGQNPVAAFILGSDGNLYGTTEGGGMSSDGAIIKVTTAGGVTVLHNFGGADGASPEAPLSIGIDGNFYGTTNSGGANFEGTVFQLTAAGSFSVLHSFNGSDGQSPLSGLMQASDGNFYGVTINGGANSDGTIYSITSSGAFNSLYSFAGADGQYPICTLLQSGNSLYGTTSEGGSNSDGTVFAYALPASPGTLQFSAQSYDVNENGGSVTLSVTRTGGSSGAVSVGYSDIDGTAEAGVDYQTNSGTLSWADGDGTAKTVTIAINDRGLTNGATLSFSVVLANPIGGAALGTISTATVNIADNDAGAAPVITSSTTATATIGQAFTYQIVGTNNPTSFEASGLPSGLTIDPSTGDISGTTNASAGTYAISLSATNDSGTGTATLMLTLAAAGQPIPAITSAPTAMVTSGSTFNYQITATHSPTAYTASGLPAGLTIDPASGIISGTSTSVGSFPIGLSAANSYGTGTGTLTLTVVPRQPSIVIVSPPNDITVVAGAPLPFAAAVTDPDGALASVQFSIGGAVAGTTGAAPPYVVDTTAPAAAGDYAVEATATDGLGRQSTDAITLHVVLPASVGGSLPTAAILTDLNGRELGSGQTVVLSATAGTSTGDPLQEVDFYADSTLIARLDGSGNSIGGTSAFVPPVRRDAPMPVPIGNIFRTGFTVPGAGNIVNLFVVAFSKLGVSQVSSPVSVRPLDASVDRPPVIAFTGLSDGMIVIAGIPITLPVSVSDPDATGAAGGAPGILTSRQDTGIGTIADLSFYLNAGLVQHGFGNDPTKPSFAFTPPAAGEYVVNAIATDGAGLSGVAMPLVIRAVMPPTINVALSGDGRAQFGVENAKVIISRTGDTSAAVTVGYKVKGSARAGVDYKALPGTATIPAGASQVKVKLKPLDNPANTGKLKAKFMLVPSAGGTYKIGGGGVAAIGIFGNS